MVPTKLKSGGTRPPSPTDLRPWQNKRDILREKRESGMALKSVNLRPKAVVLTPRPYAPELEKTSRHTSDIYFTTWTFCDTFYNVDEHFHFRKG